MTRPGYDLLVIAHVLAAVVGFGALGATSRYANLLRRAEHPFALHTLRRYFSSGRNYAARTIYLVPLIGAVLLVLGGRSVIDAAFPWIGLGLWCVAVGFATGACWPGERAIQDLYSQDDPDTSSQAREELRAKARRVESAAAAASLTGAAAFVVMIVQPR